MGSNRAFILLVVLPGLTLGLALDRHSQQVSDVSLAFGGLQDWLTPSTTANQPDPQIQVVEPSGELQWPLQSKLMFQGGQTGADMLGWPLQQDGQQQSFLGVSPQPMQTDVSLLQEQLAQERRNEQQLLEYVHKQQKDLVQANASFAELMMLADSRVHQEKALKEQIAKFSDITGDLKAQIAKVSYERMVKDRELSKQQAEAARLESLVQTEEAEAQQALERVGTERKKVGDASSITKSMWKKLEEEKPLANGLLQQGRTDQIAHAIMPVQKGGRTLTESNITVPASRSVVEVVENSALKTLVIILGGVFFFILVAVTYLHVLHKLQVQTEDQARASRSVLQSPVPESLIPGFARNQATNVDHASLTPEEQRRLVERNRQLVAQGVFFGSWLLLVLSFAVLVIYLYFIVKYYIFGWVVWLDTKDKPCDAPLSTWLLLTLLSSLLRLITGGEVNPLATLLWMVCDVFLFFMGIVWMHSATTCQSTNSELYWFDHEFLVFLIVRNVITILVTFIAIAILVYAIRNGWLEGVNAASPNVIEKMDVVSAAAAKAAGASECSICCNPFDDSEEIKRTGCNHCFHTECLGKWLKNARTCPLCRSDLQDAMEQGGHPPKQSV